MVSAPRCPPGARGLLALLLLLPLPGARGSCDDPPYIRNTFRDHSDSNLFPAGTVVKYNCDGGYELIPGISSASVTCQKDFTWSEHQEFCRKIRCPSPDITNGKAIPRKETYMYEDKIRIDCNPGYALKDQNGLIKCERNRAWQPPLPICEPACEPPARIANGRDNRGWKNVFLVGSSVSYSCNRGWSLVGVSSIRCIAGDGGTPRWDAPTPECKGSCDDPPYIRNTFRDHSDSNLFPAGTVVKYNCVGGYELIPGISSASVTCQKDFTWSEHEELCRKIRCPYPNIRNGEVRPRKETYVYEDKIRIECDRGYALKDQNGLIKCERNRAWQPPLPICEPACEPPARIANGQDDRGRKNVFLVGSSVTYECDHGWSLVGVSSIRCTAGYWGTPRWDASVPECKAHISNRWDYGGWRNVFLVGSSVTYDCDRGWSLVGVSSVQCIDGDEGIPRWDAPAPECKREAN